MKQNIFKKILKSCGITFVSNKRDTQGVANLLQDVECPPLTVSDTLGDTRFLSLSGVSTDDWIYSDPWIHSEITIPKVCAPFPQIDLSDIIDSDPLTAPLGQGKFHGFNLSNPKHIKTVQERCPEESYL